MGVSRQEYWSGLPFSSPGDLPDPGMEPTSPSLQVDYLLIEPPGKPKNTGVGSVFLLQGIFPTHYQITWRAHSLSLVQLSATSWAVALPGSSVLGVSQVRILE